MSNHTKECLDSRKRCFCGASDRPGEERPPESATCKHCGRLIARGNEGEEAWIDPEATGDDSVWRETCDSHDTFRAEHEPETQEGKG